MIKLEEFLEEITDMSIIKHRYSGKNGSFQLHLMLGGTFKIKSGGKVIFETDDAEEVVDKFNELTLN